LRLSGRLIVIVFVFVIAVLAFFVIAVLAFFVIVVAGRRSVVSNIPGGGIVPFRSLLSMIITNEY